MNKLVVALIAAAVVIGISAALFLMDGDDPKSARRNEGAARPSETDGGKRPQIPPTPTEGTIAVTGSVKEQGGAALGGITVHCHRVAGSPSAPKLEPIAMMSSGADGSFQFGKLLPGIYEFSASAAGYAGARVRETLAEGAVTPTVELVLASGLTIRGTIRDPLGAPVPGALVGAFIERIDPEAPLEEQILKLTELDAIQNEPGVFATSDQSGMYTLQGLENLGYRLQVTSSGFAPAERRYVLAGSEGIDFTLAVGGKLIGRVTDSVGGSVAGALVEVFKASGTQNLMEIIMENVLPPLDHAETDASGEYAFSSIGGDTSYRLLVRARGFQARNVADVRVDLGQQVQLDVALESGATVRGIVYDPYGLPLEGARCKVNQVGGGVTPNPPISLSDETIVTDVGGQFLFDTLGSGTHRLVVSHDEYATFTDPKVQPSGEPMTVHLTEGCAISGTIFDAVNRAPIAGAIVSVHDTGGELKSSITDAAGSYFVRGISEQRRGSAHLNVEAEGYQRVSNFKVDVAEGTVTSGQDFSLERNGVVRGIAIDADGKPIAGVRISARREHATNAVVVNVGRMATSGSDGSFVIEQVEPGESTFLEGAHRGYLTSRGELFAVVPGEEVQGLELVMRLGGAVSGQVIDEGGNPIAEATVGAKDDVVSVVNPATLSNKVYTGADGKFTLHRLEAGELTLLCAAKGYLTVEVTGLEVTEGRTTTGVEVRLTQGATISGTVRNSLGEPIHGARVTVIDTSEGLKKLTASTDSNGMYRFDELGYLPVDVEAEATGYAKVRLSEQPVNHEGIDFVLESFGALRGMVYAESGEALHAFSVTPKLIDADGRAKSRVASRTFTNTNGAWDFDGLQPGVYEVLIGAPGFAPETIESLVVNSERTTDCPAVSLGEGGRISGLVYDARSGQPVPGATVTVVGGNRHFLPRTETQPEAPGARRDQTTTREDGTFDFIGLSSGQITIKVEHRLYMSEVVRDVQSGNRDVQVPLYSGGTIEGVVTHRDGSVADGVQLLLSSGGKGQDRRIVTDRKGMYSITGLPEGIYELRATEFGQKGAREATLPREAYEVEVRAGETTVLDIVLDK